MDENAQYRVRRSDLEGSNVVDITPGTDDFLDGLAVDAAAGKLYWVERGLSEQRIVRADLEGRGREVIHRTTGALSRLAFDPAGRQLYFTTEVSRVEAGIWLLGEPGNEPQSLVPREVDDLAVDGVGGKLYWVQEGASPGYGADIWRSNLDGSEPEPIVHHLFDHYTTGIALDLAGQKIYWATLDHGDTHSQIVARANLDGSDMEPMAVANAGLDDWPVYLDVDQQNGMLYWVNGEDGVFFRVPLEGGEAEDLHRHQGPYGPFDLVVLPAAAAHAQFRRGDANGDGRLTLSDPVAMLDVIFRGEHELSCNRAADVNDDGVLDISDAIASLIYQFAGRGFSIPPPGVWDCGHDPSPDALGCEHPGSCPG